MYTAKHTNLTDGFGHTTTGSLPQTQWMSTGSISTITSDIHICISKICREKQFQLHIQTIKCICVWSDGKYSTKMFTYHTRTIFQGTYILLMSQIQHFRKFIFEDHRISA